MAVNLALHAGLAYHWNRASQHWTHAAWQRSVWSLGSHRILDFPLVVNADSSSYDQQREAAATGQSELVTWNIGTRSCLRVDSLGGGGAPARIVSDS